MKKALFIGYVWPELKTTAAGHRMMQLLQAFIEEGYEVTFVTTAAKTPYSEDLSQFKIRTEAILLNDSSFDDFVRALHPDVVVFDRFMVEEQFGWRVAEQVPNAFRILNTEDLHSLRKTRQSAHQKGEGFTIDSWLGNDITKREIASIYRSDLTLLVSLFEKDLLIEELQLSPKLLYHLPFLLDTIDEHSKISWKSYNARKNFICFGNGKHAPNIDALNYLKTDIWPFIRKLLPQVNVTVFGAYLPQQIQEMHQPDRGFLIQGWVEDLDTELQKARINLAPLRFGAGIKGKLTTAMRNGTPTISTSIGAEGMFLKDNLPVVIADDAYKFAEAAAALYQDETLWSDLQQKGVETINRNYLKETLVPDFFKTLDTLSNSLVAHRESNFIGTLLQHHTLASTKYLSKYIEAKNKSGSL